MRNSNWTFLAAIAVLAFAATLLFQPATLAEEEPALDGKTLFTETHKCNMCHGVPAEGIEAKVKSDSMKGGDLGGKIEMELGEIAAYVRKEAELDGKTHKKPFKGTDEELQAIVDWLATLEAPSEE